MSSTMKRASAHAVLLLVKVNLRPWRVYCERAAPETGLLVVSALTFHGEMALESLLVPDKSKGALWADSGRREAPPRFLRAPL